MVPWRRALFEPWEPQQDVSRGKTSAKPTKRPHLRSQTLGSELKEGADRFRRRLPLCLEQPGWRRGETLTLNKVCSLGWTFYLLK